MPTIITLPSYCTDGRVPTSARHEVVGGEVCVVPMAKVEDFPGYFGCCHHGFGIRTHDFPNDIALRFAEAAEGRQP